MNGVGSRAELAKLRQLLDANPAALDFLGELPDAQLRRLRTAISERLFDQDAALFRRLAAIASNLPSLAPLLARLVGPQLAARIVGEMPARLGARLASRVAPDYVAAICEHLDPRRARDLIQLLPVEVIVAIALALLRRRDYPTIGRFIDYLSDAAICAALAAIPDEAELLRISYFMDSRNRLDHVLHLLPPERRQRALLLALDEQVDLLDEILALVTHVNHPLMRELGDLAAAQDEAVLARIVDRAQRQGLWADLLPVIAALSEASQRKVANLPLLRDNPAVLESILLAADTQALWRITLPLIEMLDDAMLDVVAAAAARLPRQAIERAAHAVLVAELWEPMLDLVRRMPYAKQCEFVDVVAGFRGVDPTLDARLIARASAHGLDAALAATGLRA